MPEKIREWTLHAEIGRGGMGVVYRATHDIMKGEWAVKVMLPHLADDEDYRRRFLSESTVLAGLKHANIIAIQTPFQEEGRLYLPMELLTGQSLADMLKTEAGPWSALRVGDIVGQVAAGLAYVHGREPPVLHRDIKPENIQIMADGLVKIFDFGLARPVDDDAATLTGKAIGTPDYMAPELLTGKRPTTMTDVFSLGIVTYRLLTGRLPWDLPRDMAPLSRVVALVEAHRAGLPDVRKLAPHADPMLADLAMAAIAADPAARPADGAAFLEILEGRRPAARSGDTLDLGGAAEEAAPETEPAIAETGPVSWGLGTGADISGLDVDFDSPLIPKDFDDDYHPRGKVMRQAGYRGRRSGFGAGVAVLLVGLVLCAGGAAAWWLAQDWEVMRPVIDRVNAVMAAVAGDTRRGAGGDGTGVAADAGGSGNATSGGAGAVGGNSATGTAGVGTDGAAGQAAVAPDRDVREPADAVNARVDAGPGAGGAAAGAGEPATAIDEAAALAAARAAENCRIAGMTWVSIPGGQFTPGQIVVPDAAVAADAPRTVSLSSFEISRNEVTVDQYMKCVDAGACAAPYWTDCRGYSRSAKGRTGKIRDYGEIKLGFVPEEFRAGDHPIVCVNWHQANAFAAWVGGRLPSESEWEFAARGPSGRPFPWGDAKPTCRLAVMGAVGSGGPDGDTWGCGRESTWPVCSKKAGNTPDGLCDMAGNAMEWVRDAYRDLYEGAPLDGTALEGAAGDKRVCRGGAWYSYHRGVTAVFRAGHDASARDIGIGFRVARAPLPPDAGDGAGKVR